MPHDNDFVSLEDIVSSALPEGERLIRVTDIEGGFSSKKQTPQVKVSFEVVDGEFAGKDGTIMYYLSEAARRMLGYDLLACGVKGLQRFPKNTEGADYPAAVAQILAPMKGQTFKSKFAIEKDNRGIDQNRVRIIGTASGEPLNLGGGSAAPSSY